MVQLLDLPPELIQAICRQCLAKSPYQRASPAALACLSRTCSILQAHAQPELYRNPTPYRRNCLPLVRTLAKRPDLARLVQEMEIGEDWSVTDNHALSPEDVQFFETLMTKYPAEDGEPVKISSHWSEILRENRPRDGLFDCSPQGALAALVVTQIVNVESLDITVDYFWEFPFSSPGSLPRLKKLGLRHADTELGTDTDAARPIFAAAPNLTIFNGYMLRGVSSGFHHDNLTEFHLEHSCLELESFQNIASGLPKLKSFLYESGGPIISDAPEATPGEIVRALLPCADTLEHISLEFEYSCYMVDFGPEDIISDLKDMRHLRTLSLGGFSMHSEMDNPDTIDGNLLIDMLPSSLEKLTLTGGHEHMMDSIFRLAENTQSFPNLAELVVVDMEEDDLVNVRTKFKATKVKISHHRGYSMM